MAPERLEIAYHINVVEDDELRNRPLDAIVRLLRTADELKRKDAVERHATGNRADPSHEP